MSLVVRYTHAPDGTRIAYSVTGSGPPVLWLPTMPNSHFRLAWELPGVADFFQRFSAGRTLVQVDLRNTGMSQRGVQDHSQDAILCDVVAVLEAAGIDEPLCVYTSGARSTIGIRLAARYPQRVHRLLLSNPQLIPKGGTPGYFDLAKSNWRLWLEMTAERYGGDRTFPEVQRLAEFMAQCVRQDDLLQEILDADYDRDLEFARAVQCPVLILWRETAIRGSEIVARLAAELPNASVVRPPAGAAIPPFGTNPGPLLAICRDFFCDVEAESTTVALSPREQEVLLRAAAGDTNDEIARHLSLSPRTVERHFTNIYARLNVRNRAEAVAWAIRHRLD